MNVLELYSGIGGMHLALNESGVDGKIIASIEINPIANEIYKYNFPTTNLINANINGLKANSITNLDVNTIFMSPPCQPFTRNGLQNDISDPRTSSFIHILKLLPELEIKYILMENVKGFENSFMRDIFVSTLNQNNYDYQEFLLNPQQIGIPNSRLRYYCIAKKLPQRFQFSTGQMMTQLPAEAEAESIEPFAISDILERPVHKKYCLSDTTLQKRAKVLDICYESSRRSCCFTKAYGRFIEGTGSVFTDKTESEVLKVYSDISSLSKDSDQKLFLLKSLNLRFFTPREVCRLMSFPEDFQFPNSISDRKQYMVLGNSINIKMVSYLIKLLSK